MPQHKLVLTLDDRMIGALGESLSQVPATSAAVTVIRKIVHAVSPFGAPLSTEMPRSGVRVELFDNVVASALADLHSSLVAQTPGEQPMRDVDPVGGMRCKRSGLNVVGIDLQFK